MLIDRRCPNCGATMQFEDTMESMFCPFCGGMVTNEAFRYNETQSYQNAPISNEPNLYISFNSTDPSVGMVTRVVSTGVKNTYINGQTLSFHLAQGPQTIVLKIGSRNYNRSIVIPSDNSPVRIYASYNGRAHITIDQPQPNVVNNNSVSGNYSVTPTNNTVNIAPTSQQGESKKPIIFGIIGLVILLMMMRSCLCGGSSSTSQTATNERSTSSQKITSERNYSNLNIETSIQYLGDITYEAPSSWYYKESAKGYRYYYPDKNDTNVFLMVVKQDITDKNLSIEYFESSFVDGYLKGFTKDMQNVKIHSREVEQKDDYYFGEVNFEADYQGELRSIMMYIAFDNKTGTIYLFLFSQPEIISKENEDIFYYICDSFGK